MAECYQWRPQAAKESRLWANKALCDSNYAPCRGEYYLYKEWVAVIMEKSKYIAIMFGVITDKDKNDKEKHINDGLDHDCRQAHFLAHHQLLAHHCWLSFCPQEEALFQKFEISKLVRLCLDYDESI